MWIRIACYAYKNACWCDIFIYYPLLWIACWYEMRANTEIEW